MRARPVRKSAFLLPLLSLSLAVGLAIPAAAGAPGKWSKAVGDVGSSLPTPGALRTADGTLHVVTPTDVGVDEQLVHVAISPAGKSGPEHPVLAGPWPSVTSTPKLVQAGSGLRVLFSGLDGTPTSGTFYQATSTTGSTWTTPSKVGQWGFAYGTYGLGAGVFASGTSLVAGALNSLVSWKTGTSTTAGESFTLPGISIIRLNAAVDARSDQAWVVWYDLTNGGVWARQVEPTLGPPVKAPKSTMAGGPFAGQSLVPAQQLSLAVGTRGGLFTTYCTTYPTCHKAVVWRVGTNKTAPAPITRTTDVVGVGPAPKGRIWFGSHDNNTGQFTFARSNAAASRLGAPRRLASPPKSIDAYSLVMEGTSKRVDVLSNVVNLQSQHSIWHTQVIPGLSFAASPRSWSGKQPRTVRFTATDAGSGVGGVKVRAGSRSCATTKSGSCSIRFPKLRKQSFKATATVGGYATAKVVLRVR